MYNVGYVVGFVGLLGVWGIVKMEILKVLRSAMFCAAGLASLGATANAATIPVVNGDFSQFPDHPTQFAGFTVGAPGTGAPHPYLFFGCGTGCAFADDNVLGWNSTKTFDTPHGALSGQWLTGLSSGNHLTFNTGPLNNEPYVFRDINDVTSQVVGVTALAGVTYTLDVDMGFDISHADLGQIQLWVGGHEVVAGPTKTTDPRQRSGAFYDYEVSYTATAADIGDPIMIALSSLTGNASDWAWFADVRLTDSLTTVIAGAPEPATWAMMLLGFGGMAGVAAVRRSSRRRSAVAHLA
jgi:hypothetical protein